MEEARDIVGISVPFAAGVAAGAVICPHLHLPVAAFPTLAAVSTLALAITAATIAAALLSGNRTRRGLLRVCFAGIFLLTGLFCYLNHFLLEGCPPPAGHIAGQAGNAAARLKTCIDSIPYPTSTTAPLVKALLTGDKVSLDRETVLAFRKSGASHILALSGLHLGVIYVLMLNLLRPLGNSPGARRLKFLGVLACSGYYTVMTGASPSIVRAFLFICINETCKLLGRERDAAGVLLAALTVQLVFCPGAVTSVSFQLSYLAMAGIIFIYPRLERLYPEADGSAWSKADPVRKVWKAAALSIACQATTAPLAWHYFHSFPRYFIITNLIALPLTSAVIVVSTATVALSASGICPGILVLTGDRAVQLLLRCLEIIASM